MSGAMSETADHTFDAQEFRTVLGHFPTGVTIVSGMDGDVPVGFTIGSFTSVSLDPPLVGFLPMKDSSTWAAIAKNGNESDRYTDVGWHPAPTGSPVIDRAVAWIDCSIEEVFEMGDHYFVMGRVTALEADADQNGQGPFPLLFFKGTLGGFAAEG